MSGLRTLADQWREEARVLRERYGQGSLAQLAEAHAAELDEALRAGQDEVLTLGEAAAASGYSERRLRELVAEGKLANMGERGRPRFRSGDLPRRARKASGPFDADAVARRVMGRSA